MMRKGFLSQLLLHRMLIIATTALIFLGGVAFCGVFEVKAGDNYDDFNFSYGSTSVTLEEYLGTDSVVIIPSEVNGKPVAYINRCAFFNNTTITKVIIPSSVTGIGLRAFEGCINLTSVNLPSGITKIDEGTFSGCESLTEIVIPSGVTRIGHGAFGKCTNLSSVVMPSGQYTIGYGENETVINPDNFGVIYNGASEGAFEDCINLRTIDISGATTIGACAFKGTGLNEITIPSSVATVGPQAFYGVALKKIVISPGVTTIGDYAFYGNDAEEIDIPSSVMKYGNYAFYGTGVKELVFYDNGAAYPGGHIFNYNKLRKFTVLSKIGVLADDGLWEQAQNLTVYCYHYSDAESRALSSGAKVIYLDDNPSGGDGSNGGSSGSGSSGTNTLPNTDAGDSRFLLTILFAMSLTGFIVTETLRRKANRS